MPDRRTPFTVADEMQTLRDFLGYLRESVVLKLEGVSEEDARWSPVPSGTSLLRLVKHLTFVEAVWFQYSFAGTDDPLPPYEPDDSGTVEAAVAAYRAAIAASNDTIAGCSDLEQLCARHQSGRPHLTLRWVLVHLVEETARHAGHADIIREEIDGSVGR